MPVPARLLLAAAGLLLSASSVHGQPPPRVGVRAAGMGGAFVAVADDASAVYWNPAGLASGAFVSVVVDRNQLFRPEDAPDGDAPSGLLVAASMPALGFSYSRTQSDHLSAQQFGVTLVQSLRDRLAVGATLYALHAGTETHRQTRFDADVGVLASSSVGRLGLTVHNLFEPSFDTSDGQIRRQRQFRGGASLLVRQLVTVALDSDFTVADTPKGRWRDLAIGGEVHVLTRLWARSGVHWNTAGGGAQGLGAAPVASIGGSVPVSSSLLVDGQLTVGSKNGDRGWGVGARFVY
jgi:hypothetical protein